MAAIEVRLRRGTAAQIASFTGAQGELTYATDTKDLFVHDGSTPGGFTAGMESGTSMVFFQAAAPTGWTKSSANDDKALRVVSGTGGGTGGTDAFSTTFSSSKATDAHTLVSSEMPTHNHTFSIASNTNPGGLTTTASNTVTLSGSTTGNAGGDGSHTHNITMDVNYLDVIVCTKD